MTICNDKKRVKLDYASWLKQHKKHNDKLLWSMEKKYSLAPSMHFSGVFDDHLQWQETGLTGLC